MRSLLTLPCFDENCCRGLVVCQRRRREAVLDGSGPGVVASDLQTRNQMEYSTGRDGGTQGMQGNAILYRSNGERKGDEAERVPWGDKEEGSWARASMRMSMSLWPAPRSALIIPSKKPKKPPSYEPWPQYDSVLYLLYLVNRYIGT